MGPSILLQAKASKVPPMGIVFMDCLGHFHSRLTRNMKIKVFILCITCVWTRFSQFIVLEDMTSNSVLQAVKTAAYQIGGGLPLLVHSDSASSFIPLSRLEAPTDDEGGQESQNSQSVKTFNPKSFKSKSIMEKQPCRGRSQTI